MARKTMSITIEDDNRDKGRTYHIQEMAVEPAEYWAARALAIISKADISIPPEAVAGGMSAIAAIGVQMLVKGDIKESYPLMDELLNCVTVRPDPDHPNVVRKLAPGDIEEFGTRMRLKFAALGLHLGFSQAAVNSTSSQSSTSTQPATSAHSPDILTPRRRSQR